MLRTRAFWIFFCWIVLVASLVGPTISGFSRALAGGFLPAYLILLALAVVSFALALREKSAR